MRCVRHILSLLLFNLYSEIICQTTLSEVTEDLIINDKMINNIRYASYANIWLAGKLEELQHLIQCLNCWCNNYGLKINLKKTKLMIITKAQNIRANLMIDNIVIERVTTINTYEHE